MKIIVFGATSTIAKEVQKIYASRGDELWLIGRNETELQSISADLRVRGAKTHFVVQNLAEFQKADQFVGNLWNQAGGFDLCFMAHGILGSQKEDERSSIATLSILDSNMNSHIAYLTPMANLMEGVARGNIAVITSVAGDRGKQSNYIYCAAKAGKIAFLSGLRSRLFKSNVSVTDLRLGFVDTAMTAQFKKGALWAKPDVIARKIVESIDARRDVVYLPKIWCLIMLIIRSIPEFIFKKLNL